MSQEGTHPAVQVELATAATPAAPPASSAPPTASLAEACGRGNYDDVVAWMRRLAPARPDPEEPADVSASGFSNSADAEGRTAFHWCVAQRQFNLAERLLTPPTSCMAATTDREGCTSLISAVSAQAPLSVVSSIISASSGPEFINAQDGVSGNTALHAAASRGSKDVVLALLAAGANPLIQSRNGQSALHKTIPRGATEVADTLISHVRKTDLKNTKKFVNLQDVNGDTALHHCSAENNRDFGEALLRNGADRIIKNKKGQEFWQIS
jgi:ankyrin repeat protein